MFQMYQMHVTYHVLNMAIVEIRKYAICLRIIWNQIICFVWNRILFEKIAQKDVHCANITFSNYFGNVFDELNGRLITIDRKLRNKPYYNSKTLIMHYLFKIFLDVHMKRSLLTYKQNINHRWSKTTTLDFKSSM